MSASLSPDARQKKKSGCFSTLAKLCLFLIALSVAISLIAPKAPDAPVSKTETSAPSPLDDSRPANHPDHLSGASLGESVGKEMASYEGGRPYPKGIELMAKARLDQAKPNNQKEWIKGFEAGFTKGWDSVRNGKKLNAYSALTWETAQTGVLLYDINENHVATIVLPDPATDIAFRFHNQGIAQRYIHLHDIMLPVLHSFAVATIEEQATINTGSSSLAGATHIKSMKI